MLSAVEASLTFLLRSIDINFLLKTLHSAANFNPVIVAHDGKTSEFSLASKWLRQVKTTT